MMLRSQIQSVLFASGKPATYAKLAKLFNCGVADIESEVNAMLSDQQASDTGIVLVRDGDQVQLATSSANAQLVEKFVRGEQSGELTRPSLETLTIVAYRGPVTKAELEMIRGVNCSLILRNLLIRGLIREEAGKSEEPVYRVSLEFLRWLGVSQASDLPDYEKLSNSDLLLQILKQ